MPAYLVETYLARENASERDACARRAVRAAEALTASGTTVRFERAIHLPEDEMCLFLFEADSLGAAREAADRAGLDHFRIVKVVPSEREEP